MTFKPLRTQQHLQTPAQKAEAAFHQAIREFLSKKDQGRVMGVFRDFQKRGLIGSEGGPDDTKAEG